MKEEIRKLILEGKTDEEIVNILLGKFNNKVLVLDGNYYGEIGTIVDEKYETSENYSYIKYLIKFDDGNKIWHLDDNRLIIIESNIVDEVKKMKNKIKELIKQGKFSEVSEIIYNLKKSKE